MALISWINGAATSSVDFMTGRVDGVDYQDPDEWTGDQMVDPRLAPKSVWESQGGTLNGGIELVTQGDFPSPGQSPAIIGLFGIERPILEGGSVPWIKVRIQDVGLVWQTYYITFSPSWGFRSPSYGLKQSYQHSAFLVLDNTSGLSTLGTVQISFQVYPGSGSNTGPWSLGSVWVGQALEFTDGIDRGWRIEPVDGGLSKRSEGGQTFARRRTVADVLHWQASVQNESDVFMANNATSWRACQRYTGSTSPVVMLPKHVVGGPSTTGGTPVPGSDEMHEVGIYGYFQKPLGITDRKGSYYKVGGSILEER